MQAKKTKPNRVWAHSRDLYVRNYMVYVDDGAPYFDPECLYPMDGAELFDFFNKGMLIVEEEVVYKPVSMEQDSYGNVEINYLTVDNDELVLSSVVSSHRLPILSFPKLASLTISNLTGITPEFSPEILEYDCSTNETTSTLTYTTEPGDVTVVVSLNDTVVSDDTITWKTGSNELTITVTAGEIDTVYVFAVERNVI